MTNTALKHSFTLNWILDAPPAEVFRAWTDPEHLGWFHNPDNPIPTEPIELRHHQGVTVAQVPECVR